MSSSDLHIQVRAQNKHIPIHPCTHKNQFTKNVPPSLGLSGDGCSHSGQEMLPEGHSHLCPTPRPKWKMGMYPLLPRDKREDDICHHHRRRMTGL